MVSLRKRIDMVHDITVKDVPFEELQVFRALVSDKLIKVQCEPQQPTLLDIIFWRPLKWKVTLFFEQEFFKC